MALLSASTVSLPAGGGAFELPALTIGVFGSDQPTHRISHGSDRAAHVPLGAGQGWVMPPGSEGLCEYDAPLDVTYVSVGDGLLRDAGLEPGATLAPLVGELDPMLLSMARSAEGFGAGGTLYAETMARALAAQLVHLMRPSEPAVAAIDDARLRRVVEHIHAHLADDLSMDAMAGIAAMSATQFARAFRAATGSSPLQYVIAERLERAIVLLRTTRLSVAEIAYRVGYNDVPRFGQHFKRRFGTTPGAARAG